MYLGKVHTGPARKVGEFFAFEDLLNIQSIELEQITGIGPCFRVSQQTLNGGLLSSDDCGIRIAQTLCLVEKNEIFVHGEK